ncbi:phage tail tube protein [Ensifer sp. ZNC0028]|uniref:phage tail tube protein n=1 Tax=Ensifer sp. ZNC0028 TaxID=1339236 RepID=UPI0005B8C705|nr:phage tail tube protein [Ensifer sp. ZNC0028]
MTRAVTENFHEMVVEVETTPGSGVFAKLCGLTSRTTNRTSNMSTSEVPDCDNEALPAAVERAVQSQEVTISGTGVWAAQSHGTMMDWWYSGATKNIRVGHLKAEPGDTEYETGPAYLVTLNNTAERGAKVTAEIEIQFDGLPVRTPAASGT